jgi:hypothetical protein
VSANQNKGVEGVWEEFISKKSFDLSLLRSQECKECVGDQNPQRNQGQKG